MRHEILHRLVRVSIRTNTMQDAVEQTINHDAIVDGEDDRWFGQPQVLAQLE